MEHVIQRPTHPVQLRTSTIDIFTLGKKCFHFKPCHSLEHLHFGWMERNQIKNRIFQGITRAWKGQNKRPRSRGPFLSHDSILALCKTWSGNNE